ncbi:hypothetical protein GE061_008184 [Apolygus lucorum]|uniref:Uncharacterized protein n=1 Tax=Apolygus lucorum TaxID=248454 RepID=A0A6A4ISN9_APOLU|nr:hypothetical protein GE061_008184 [Apolygus lucorum]
MENVSAPVVFGMAGIEAPGDMSSKEADMKNRFSYAILRGSGVSATPKVTSRRAEANKVRRVSYHWKRDILKRLTNECKRMFKIDVDATVRTHEMYNLGDINDAYLSLCCNLVEDGGNDEEGGEMNVHCTTDDHSNEDRFIRMTTRIRQHNAGFTVSFLPAKGV